MQFYVDGGCRGNGQPGSIGSAAACFRNRWGKYNCWTRDLNRSVALPTNQRAEITAIILALELALKKFEKLDSNPYLEVEIFSDSKYAVGCMTEWIYKWSQNGWTNAAGNPVANQDLIRKASDLDDRLREEGKVNYTWIPRSQNEVADQSCNEALDKQEREKQQQQQQAYYDSSDDSDYC